MRGGTSGDETKKTPSPTNLPQSTNCPFRFYKQFIEDVGSSIVNEEAKQIFFMSLSVKKISTGFNE